MERSVSFSAPLARHDGAQRADDPFGSKNHDQDEGSAKHRLPALGIGAYRIFKRDDRGRSDKAAEQCTAPPAIIISTPSTDCASATVEGLTKLLNIA